MTEQRPQAVVIGASAGALEALYGILPVLPVGFALPIMVVVHLPSDKETVMADLLQVKCKMQVKEAEDKEPLKPGMVYLAPPNYHLLVEKNRRLSLSSEEPVLHSRPSINVLFESASDVYENALIGIILSGANNDGSQGLKAIMEAGGIGLVLRPELAYASAMPQAALVACTGAKALDLPQIAEYLQKAAVT